ncbi:MAG: hypothetical protein J6Y69_04665 [Treponema sp.]|nr:hypothetical protein [Treponema sp.]
MTLKTRNIFFIIFFSFSIVFGIFCTAFFIISAVTGHIDINLDVQREFKLFSTIFPYRFWGTVSAIFAFTLYLPVTMGFIYFGFEKTRSQEIIFFFIFLVACLLEQLRLFFPLHGMWKTSSDSLIYFGRIIIMGRTMAFLSALFLALFSGPEHRMDMERNVLILVLISAVIGYFYPLDTMITTSSFMIRLGYGKMFEIGRFIIIVLAIITLFVNNYSAEEKGHKESIGFLLLFIGYLILIECDSYVPAGIGIVVLITGTILYLKPLHSRMWS